MKVCDCHCHVGEFYDQINKKHVSYSPAELVKCMHEADVDLAIVSNISAVDAPMQANFELAEWVEEYRELVPIAWTTPEVTKVGEVRQLFALGFRGLKFHPTAGGYRADSNEVDRYLRICAQEGKPALFHCAADESSAPERYMALAERNPDVWIILAHMNLFGPAEAAIRVAEAYPNICLDTSWARPEDVKDAILRIGAERILWGTDAPLGGECHYRRDRVRAALESKLDEGELKSVMWGNAARLFSL